MTLLLASASTTRLRLLVAAGVEVEVRRPDFDEDGVKASLRARGMDAIELACALALAKAKAVTADAGQFVLGCDQTLELDDGVMLDKPESREEAAAQLRRMASRAHRLHAAAAVVQAGSIIWEKVESVTMHVRPLGEPFIQAYLDSEWEAIRWSVGGYHIEGRGAQLFDRVEGSHFAVQGLPLLPLLTFLRDRGLLIA